jgi:hypothetical protein
VGRGCNLEEWKSAASSINKNNAKNLQIGIWIIIFPLEIPE